MPGHAPDVAQSMASSVTVAGPLSAKGAPCRFRPTICVGGGVRHLNCPIASCCWPFCDVVPAIRASSASPCGPHPIVPGSPERLLNENAGHRVYLGEASALWILSFKGT